MKNVPNIYSIIGRAMIKDAFDEHGNHAAIEKSINKNNARGQLLHALTSARMPWFSSLIEKCEKFLKEECEEVYGDIASKFEYDIIYSEDEPRLTTYSYLEIDVVIEEGDDSEEEWTHEHVDGIVVYWFEKKNGQLRKIEAIENVTGQQWELWPDLEDFTAEEIRVDRDQANAEGLG